MNASRTSTADPAIAAAVDASEWLPGELRSCSLHAGWSSLLIRSFREPAEVEPFETKPTSHQLIVLMKEGNTRIESRRRGRWHTAEQRSGTLGFAPPGASSSLRWSGDRPHVTVQLYLPEMLLSAAEDDRRERRTPLSRPDALSTQDPLVQSTILALEQAVELKLSDLYADTAAHFLAVHLTSRQPRSPRSEDVDTRRLNRLEEYMRANLSGQVSLATLAQVVDCSTFQLIRLTKRGWGRTPVEHLARLRMENAVHLLRLGAMTTAAISAECGYSNPAHFATAFRRIMGATPTAYRG